MSKLILSCLATFVFVLPVATQTPPAPEEDRVGFPRDYATEMSVLYVFDRADNRSVRTIYGNRLAASVTNGLSAADYPYGSVLVMETWRALQTSAGVPILDENGRFQKDPTAVPTLFVMRKERGFGEAYGPNRTGEWEYVAYRTDGSHQTTPRNSFSCAQCHLLVGGARDWVFRHGAALRGGSGALPDAVIMNYKFVPGVVRVKAGQSVTFYNQDFVEHTITDDVAGQGDSGRMTYGNSLTVKFTEPGEFNFHCSIHPSMRGKVIVEPE
jgi:plastocyanin